MDIVVRKIEKHLVLAADERVALRQTFASTITLEAGEDVASAGETVTFVGALLQGHLCRAMTMKDGSRQILGLPLAGDTVEMQSSLLGKMDHSVTAITRCTVAIATKEAMETLIEDFPRLAAVLCRNVAIEASVSRQWMSSLGRRDAYSRLAHLFCELFARMADAGLAGGSSYAMPLTQGGLADATGSSVVHVNRVLKQLREANLLTVRKGGVYLNDWDGLTSAGAFEQAYLHLNEVYRPSERPSGGAFSHKSSRSL